MRQVGYLQRLYIYIYIYIYLLWRCGPTRSMASSFFRFLDHTQRRITVGRTSLDEWSARRRDLYLTTHNTHNRQTSMMPHVGFGPTISACERPKTYASDGASTGTGINIYIYLWIKTYVIHVKIVQSLIEQMYQIVFSVRPICSDHHFCYGLSLNRSVGW